MTYITMSQTFETGFTTTLAQKLNSTDTTAVVAQAPTVTKGRFFLKSGNTKAWIKFTGVSGTTLTGVTFVSQTADPSTTVSGQTFVAGTVMKLVAMHDQLSDKQEGLPVKVYASAAARDADITSPSNGMSVYLTDAGSFYDYVAGAWTARANGTNVNASTTVAGRVEIATTAETIAGTDTGGTGASLSALPSDIAKNIQSSTFIYGADAGGDDTYVVALTPTLTSYTTGQTLQFKVTTANTGACSVDFGPGAKNIKTKDGNDPQSGVLRASGIVTVRYDGTNMVIVDEDFATTANKGIVEMATDAELATSTDQTRYVNPYQVAFTITASDSTLASSDATVNVGAFGSYTKVKEMVITRAGTYRTAFDLQGNGGGTAFSRIYKNDVALGTERSTNAGPTTYTEDFAFVVGDLVQVYGYGTGAGTRDLSNFRLKGTAFPTRALPTVNI